MELILPLFAVAAIALVYLSARKQRQAVAKVTELQDSIEIGDEVLMSSGIEGTVVGLTDTHVELELAPGVTTRWLRGAIRDRVADEVDAEIEELTESTGIEAPDSGDERQ